MGRLSIRPDPSMIPGVSNGILISDRSRLHVMEYREVLSRRRSEYNLDCNIDVPVSEIVDMVSDVAVLIPSPFNIQSHRALVLFGGDHDDYWNIVREALVEKIGEGRFNASRGRVDSFAAAAGTVLFFIDDPSVERLCSDHPSYAPMFPVWAEQSCGMFQYAIWMGFRDLGLGANLQHYNPLVDSRVRKRFNVPYGYRLVSQMPFGRVVEPVPPRPSLDREVLVSESHW